MLSDAMIDAALMRYRRGMHRHRALTSLVMDACRQVLEDDLVPATVHRALGPSETPGVDVAVMDNFIYGEPVRP